MEIVQVFSTSTGGCTGRSVQPMQYVISYCISWTDLPVQPPVEVEKTWTITKTDTAIIITCNNVEVLNYLFADSSNSNCVSLVRGGNVEKIRFNNGDTASDFYRVGKCLDLIITLIL